MNCQQANRLLPLWVGHDLADASEAEALQAHLAECADCALQQRRLQASLEVLQSVSTVSLETASGGASPSLWPRLAMLLKDIPRRRDHFNGWIPAAAMALAATLMVAVSVVQIRREMGHPVQTTWSVDSSHPAARNLFPTGRRIAPDDDGHFDLQRPGMVQPVNFQRRDEPEF
jgi:hypothetical protein